MSYAKKKLTKGQQDYMAKLRDPRWQKKKNRCLESDDYTCTWCGTDENGGLNLQVHHGFYSREFKNPWEYPDESLFTLCEKCHPQAESVRDQIKEALGHLPPQFHHHIFYAIQGLFDALENGEPLEALELPWAVKPKEAA